MLRVQQLYIPRGLRTTTCTEWRPLTVFHFRASSKAVIDFCICFIYYVKTMLAICSGLPIGIFLYMHIHVPRSMVRAIQVLRIIGIKYN